jgi:hypothetical protein
MHTPHRQSAGIAAGSMFVASASIPGPAVLAQANTLPGWNSPAGTPAIDVASGNTSKLISPCNSVRSGSCRGVCQARTRSLLAWGMPLVAFILAIFFLARYAGLIPGLIATPLSTLAGE